MDCPFCCLLKEHIGEYVGIGFICNCYLDDPRYNHAYGFGYIRRSSFYGDSIRLYYQRRGGNVAFTANCEDIFEIYFPPYGDSAPMTAEELKTLIEEKEKITLTGSFEDYKEEKSNE